MNEQDRHQPTCQPATMLHREGNFALRHEFVDFRMSLEGASTCEIVLFEQPLDREPLCNLIPIWSQEGKSSPLILGRQFYNVS